MGNWEGKTKVITERIKDIEKINVAILKQTKRADLKVQQYIEQLESRMDRRLSILEDNISKLLDR